MNRANQLMDQVILDLEKSMIDSNYSFTLYFKSLAMSQGLMQKLIESHDAQIAAAIDRNINRHHQNQS
jgi:hypothetical protein